MTDYIESNTIVCFWTGTNPMSEARRKCYESMCTVFSDCTLLLITPSNLASYILPEYPLHEAYQYLSETHKADYLRTYFMHFYGGGYSDIKQPSRSWRQAFEDMRNNPTMVLNGYHEEDEGCIAGDASVKQFWKQLAGNGCYIVRPRTAFTTQWYTTMIQLLDTKLEVLKLNPSTHPQCCATNTTNKYPIEWNEMLGRIFHKISCAYVDKFLHTVPRFIRTLYR